MTEFDYWYYEESTDSNGRHLEELLPVLVRRDRDRSGVQPAHDRSREPVHALGRPLGMHDIEFEFEAFNKAFNVKSQDRKFANDMIDARMMQWLMARGRRIPFELVGDMADGVREEACARPSSYRCSVRRSGSASTSRTSSTTCTPSRGAGRLPRTLEERIDRGCPVDRARRRGAASPSPSSSRTTGSSRRGT